MLGTLFMGVFTCSVIMSVVALGYLLISRTLKKKQSARWRYAAWWLLGIGFLTPFKLPLFGRPLYEFGTAADDMRYIAVRDVSTMFYDVPRSGRGFVMFWLLGIVITGMLMLRRHMKFTRSMKRLRRPADSFTQTMLELTCIELGIPCNMQIYTLPVIVSPMMTGLFRPVILMPERTYDREELRLILKHELLHRMHGDLWCKLLWMGCRVMHWFNPLMPMLMRHMEQDCELACDEAVMRGESAETAGIYCSSILETALHQVRTGRNAPVLATNFSGGKEMLRDRMDSVLSRRRKRRYLIVFALTAFGILLTGQVFARRQTTRTRIGYVPENPSETAISVTAMNPQEYSGVKYTTFTTVTATVPAAYFDEGYEPEMPVYTTAAMPVPSATATTSVMPEMYANQPVMTTVIVGADGVIYAVSAYAQQTTVPAAVTAPLLFHAE